MILPGRKVEANGLMGGIGMYMRRGWNECLDEIERLNLPPEAKVGELWLVKLGTELELRQVKVVNFSASTVLLDFAPGMCQTSTDGCAIIMDAQQRYLLEDVRFVERLDEAA